MTIEQGNIEIAKMLNAYSIKEWEGISTPERPYYLGECFYLNRKDKTWSCGSANYEDVEKSLTQTLKFHKEFESLFEAVKFINETHNNGLPRRDLMYTMQYLLSGGYLFSEEKLEWLPFSIENLFNRVALFAKHYNSK